MKTLFVFLVLCVGACAQTAPANPASSSPSATVTKPTATGAAPPPGLTVSDPSFPLPSEDRLQVRNLQVEYDELEIDIQRMLLRIEQSKQRQVQLMDAIRLIAYQFSQAKHVDLELYELDPKEIKFVRKKGK